MNNQFMCFSPLVLWYFFLKFCHTLINCIKTRISLLSTGPGGRLRDRYQSRSVSLMSWENCLRWRGEETDLDGSRREVIMRQWRNEICLTTDIYFSISGLQAPRNQRMTDWPQFKGLIKELCWGEAEVNSRTGGMEDGGEINQSQARKHLTGGRYLSCGSGLSFVSSV